DSLTERLNGGPFAFAPDSKTLAIASADGTASLWDAATGQLRAALNDAQEPFAFSPDSKTLATFMGLDDNGNSIGVQLWDAASGQLKSMLRGAGGPLAFSPEGRTLATEGDAHTVWLWDVASRQIKTTFDYDPENYIASLHRIAFSPDGRTLAIGVGTGGSG